MSSADCPGGSGSERIRRRLELLSGALADAGNGFFVFIGEESVPVRPLADLLRLLRFDGLSTNNSTSLKSATSGRTGGLEE